MYSKILSQNPKEVRILYLPINNICFVDDISDLKAEDKTLIRTNFEDYPEFLRLWFDNLPYCDPNFVVKAYFPIIYRSVSATIERALTAQVESIFDCWDLMQKPDTVHLEIFRYIKRGEKTEFDPSIAVLLKDEYIWRWSQENMVDRREKYIKSKVKETNAEILKMWNDCKIASMKHHVKDSVKLKYRKNTKKHEPI